MILAVTGHRPEKLGGYGDPARERLEDFATDVLSDMALDEVITGMALGWDQAIAVACVRCGIPFVAAIPFKEQANRWPEDSQRRWQELIGAAKRIDIVSEWPGSRAMLLRNKWMVDRCDELLALWNGDTTGGTAHCVNYAMSPKRSRLVHNVWPRWIGDPVDAVLG